MSISINEVEKIANLARLEINNEEKIMFTHQLADILKYIEKLNQIDTQNIEPTAQILDLFNVFRDDELDPSLKQEDVISLAPDSDNGCFKVPKVIE